MNLPLPTLSILAFFLACCTSLSATEDRQLREILDKHVEAMGGWRNWNQVESIRLTGTIERDGQTVDFVIIKKRPNQIRATITVLLPGTNKEALQVIRAHDGDSAWTATRGRGDTLLQKEELGDKAALELQADAGVLPKLINLWQAGAKLQFAGQESRGDKHYFRVKGRSEETETSYEFLLNAETYLVHEYTTTRKETTRTSLSDYIEQDGVRIPKVFEVREADRETSTIMVTDSIEIGVGIYNEYFEAGDPVSTVLK